MKTTKRIAFLLSVLLALSVLLSACDLGHTGEGGTTSGDEAKETTGEAESESSAEEGMESESTSDTEGETTSGESETTATEWMDLSKLELSDYITLGQYRDVAVALKNAEYLLYLRVDLFNSGAEYEKIESGDRTVAEGDLICVDYTGYLDGVAFENGAATDAMITVYEGTGYIDGFASGFIGSKAGESSSFDVTFPENYGESSLAGKSVTFMFTVKYICEFGELTDALAEKLSDGSFHSAAEYEAYERNLMVQKILWITIVENAEVLQYPEQQVQYYYEQSRAYYESYAAYYGMTYEALLTYYGLTDSDIYESARSYVAEDLVYYAILETENIALTEDEYAEKYASYALLYKENFGYTDAELAEIDDSIRSNMLYDKVQELLIEWANVTWQ